MKRNTPRPVNGVELTSTEFRQAIADVAKRYGTGFRMDDLVREFGFDYWNTTENRRVLSTAMMNMVKSGVLVKKERGVYDLGFVATMVGGGVNRYDQNQQGLRVDLRELGGMARFKEIVNLSMPDGVTRVRYQGNPEKTSRRHSRPYHTTRSRMSEDEVQKMEFARAPYLTHLNSTSRTLRKTKLIRRDARYKALSGGRNYANEGWYNLPYDEFMRIPMQGRAASVLTKRFAFEAFTHVIDRQLEETPDWGTPQKLRDQLLWRHQAYLGETLRLALRARGDEDSDLILLAGRPAVKTAFASLERHDDYEKTWLDAKAAVRERMKQEDDDVEITQREIVAELLLLLLEGEPSIHIAMNAQMWEALADYLHVDAAYLSLGMLIPAETETGGPSEEYLSDADNEFSEEELDAQHGIDEEDQ